MTFSLKPGALRVTDIEDGDLDRLARIEIAILREVGSIKRDPTVNGTTTLHFRIERTYAARTVLRGFQIEA